MHLAKHCLLLATLCALSNTAVFAETASFWSDQNTIAARGLESYYPSNDRGVENARTLTLNTEAMKALLVPSVESSPSDTNLQARAAAQISVELPLPDGSNVQLTLEKTTVLPPKLAAKYSSIMTYKVAEANGDVVSGRVDFTELGFHAMLQTVDGQTLFIDPADTTSSENYISYRKAEQSSDVAFQCNEPGNHSEHAHSPLSERSPFQSRAAARTRSNEGIIEYRMAIAATGEYTQLQGGTTSAALSAMATTLNRVNHVYEQSLGIRLSLIENNDELIYTNSSTDPYSNYNIESMLAENQKNLDSVIGSENYDIGHVFGTSGGGLAYIGSVCTGNNKARGASGIRNPNNDSFDIDYVAHEIGHQFGATHTFNSNQGICTSGARTSISAFEPGSGSSIMSYVGGCGTDDLQSFADAMFHSGNIEQINQNVMTGTASSCGIAHASTNSAPLAFAGSSYTIPANTPFELTAAATDADNDLLQYSWEQIDTGTASALKVDTGNNPLFRILPPTNNAMRSFPALQTILGTGFVKGETLPSTDRTMNFQVAVYDGNHAPSLDRVSLKIISNNGGFKLHLPASQYKPGTTIGVSWDTANTQNSPINCSTVDLELSTNGGNLFDVELAKNIPNTGYANVYLPQSIATTNSGRFKLSCSNNIFFSISSKNFTIDPNVQANAADTRNTENTTTAQTTPLSGGGSMSLSIFLLLISASFIRKHAILNKNC